MSIELSPGRVCEWGNWDLLSGGREVRKVQGLGLDLGKTDQQRAVGGAGCKGQSPQSWQAAGWQSTDRTQAGHWSGSEGTTEPTCPLDSEVLLGPCAWWWH